MAKRTQGSLINFGFSKKLCSDDVNNTIHLLQALLAHLRPGWQRKK